MTGSSSDEAAGRLRAAEKASRAYDQYGNRLPSMTVVANADLAEILDEREQLRARLDIEKAQCESAENLLIAAEAKLAAEPVRVATGVMTTPLPERFEEIRNHYMEFGFSGPTDLDRERDQVIGYLLDQAIDRRDERDAATARAEQAEALAAERVEAARQREETWRDSAMQANAELAKLRAVVQAADDVRIGHGGAWCAHRGKAMREGTIAVRAPHCVVCPGCAEQQHQDSEEGEGQ